MRDSRFTPCTKTRLPACTDCAHRTPILRNFQVCALWTPEQARLSTKNESSLLGVEKTAAARSSVMTLQVAMKGDSMKQRQVTLVLLTALATSAPLQNAFAHAVTRWELRT